MKTDREAFHQGLSSYVPAMQFASHVVEDAPSWFSLGIPALSDDDAVALATPANAVAGTDVAYTWTSDCPYGRNIIVTPSGVPGNANVLDVYGFDYLMQPMVERFTGSAAASTPLVGKKAFYIVNRSRIVTASSNAITAKIVFGALRCLPYKCGILAAKEGGVVIAYTNAQLVVADQTDPATGVTGDPRGTYAGLGAFNGVKKIEVSIVGDPAVNAANNAGLHGIRQYYA